MLWLTTIIHHGTAKIKIRDLPTTTTTQKGRTTDKRYRSSIKRANNRKKNAQNIVCQGTNPSHMRKNPKRLYTKRETFPPSTLDFQRVEGFRKIARVKCWGERHIHMMMIVIFGYIYTPIYILLVVVYIYIYTNIYIYIYI